MTEPIETVGRAIQGRIYRDGVFGKRPPVPVHPDRLEAAARRAMSRDAWGYTAGSAGLETTAAANRAAFDRRRIVPNMLTDVAERDISVELFGRRHSSPLLFAPIGVLELMHRDADLAVARAARELGIPMTISTQASHPMEDICAELGETDRWFQLYWSKDKDVVASMLDRAERSGAGAIVVTLDTHILGWRTRDLDRAFLPFARGQGIAQYTSDPAFTDLVRRRAELGRQDGDTPRPTPTALRSVVSMTRRYPGRFRDNLRSPLPRTAVETFLDVFSNSALTWEDLPFLRQHTSLPIVLKGLQHPEDAARALDAGVDGIVVSNHGGRQVDGAVGSLDALPGIVDRVAGQVPVLFDSGIRTGADVFKALALGASAVLLGRPYAYGLAVAGQAGVREVTEHLLAELDITMGLTGCRSIGAITPERLTN
ncbi:alpha-hydroxy-acid oxidizing protein [Haloechinothrix sp. YIM 98757]|uniref:Alpha-hydroxy-acid oxidizing protein n=1 Tax=Haloechinothrix aidingensis TaxID=2752311 RepID=A0A838ABL2_9PSEU|nr:lactate 2-monooxygenase [Haloechinothrix aidingensis]MBA0126616.1 alpha-hydroxy-acid oxidizing protein [Haloechinothrix aidingensis]